MVAKSAKHTHERSALVCQLFELNVCVCCSMGFLVLVMCGLRRLRTQIKTMSRLTETLLRICVATLLLTHACRTVMRNSVWRGRQSLFTYATMRFVYVYENLINNNVCNDISSDRVSA